MLCRNDNVLMLYRSKVKNSIPYRTLLNGGENYDFVALLCYIRRLQTWKVQEYTPVAT